MSGKFITCKKITIPILSLVMLLSQATQVFAITPADTASLMQHTPTVLLEIYEGQIPSKAITENDVLEAIVSKVAQSEQIKEALEEFTDVKPSDWFYADVMQAKKDGLVQGVGHGLYAPRTTITYAQFITTLVRVYREDSKIKEVTNSKHWADKYISAARNMGMFSKGEVVEPDKPISRQEMIRYTVNLLGLEPAESASIIFADVKPEDAKYINIAYQEYLTEGSGRNAEGLKVFGFDKTSLRSEMAAMVNRVKSYKTNQTEFKKERAKARAEADTKYESQHANYETWHGYKIPRSFKQVNKRTTGDFDGFAWVGHPDELDVLEQILSSKLDPSVVKQAIDYAKTKDNQRMELNKVFPTGNYNLTVTSAWGGGVIDLGVWEK